MEKKKKVWRGRQVMVMATVGISILPQVIGHAAETYVQRLYQDGTDIS